MFVLSLVMNKDVYLDMFTVPGPSKVIFCCNKTHSHYNLAKGPSWQSVLTATERRKQISKH